MALRVLLADESSTIKKVMQLALQDFAVEVKAVAVGVDVLEVARQFKPDIIFVDVLLQKRNGYEVCAELKAEASTRHTPTVLMWSSFMELDQEQLDKAQPNEKLEKPFDVEALRKVVLALVPSTRTQRLAHFLEFPESLDDSIKKQMPKPVPEAERSPERVAIPMPPPTPPSTAGQTRTEIAGTQTKTMANTVPLPPPISQTKTVTAVPQTTGTNVPLPPPLTQTKTGVKAPAPTPAPKQWSMDDFEDINEFASQTPAGHAEDNDEDFAPMNLSKPKTSAPRREEEEELSIEPQSEPAQSESWTPQDLSRFKVDLPPVSVESDEIDLKIDMGEEEFASNDFLYKPGAPRTLPHELEPRALREEQTSPTQKLELEPTDDELTQPVLEVQDDNAPGGLSLERDEVAEPLEPVLSREKFRESTAQPSGVPQLSADRLEEIIRAQSREIIEDVVRRVVPDIATELIREELERLLEETSVRESRRREPRP